MKMRLFVLACAVLCLTTGSAFADLQSVLDSITVAPVAGNSSANVATDALSDSLDSLWSITGTGGALSTVIVELAGYAGSNTLGVYDAANPANRVQLFAGADAPGDQALLSILADGSVVVNFANTGVDFAGNLFGFYLGSPDGTFFSDTALNGDNVDHMLAVEGTGTDTIQIPPFAAGLWTTNEFAMGWEDLYGGGDLDYDDLVIMVESVVPVPLPGAVLLGMLGLGYAGMRLRRMV